MPFTNEGDLLANMMLIEAGGDAMLEKEEMFLNICLKALNLRSIQIIRRNASSIQ